MSSFLRAVWALPRSPGAPRRVWRDWVLVAVVGTVAVFEVLWRSDLVWPWPSLLLELALVASLLWRRTHPGLVAVVVFGASGLFEALRLLAGVAPTDHYTSVFALIVLYALARWGSGRELVVGGAVFLLSAIGSFAASAWGVGDVIGGSAVVAIPIALGAIIRYRAAVRVERLEQVRVHERASLARDLHDTVAHHVSAIALRAQAGLATSDTSGQALRDIEAEASLTLREMRSLVGMLREEGARLSPGAVEIGALAAGPGLPVRLHITGDVDALPAPIATAVFRIAQESITNARRHAEGATAVEVAVAVGEAGVTLRVSDDGRVVARRTASAPGFGIVGMVERADLLGGVCVAGPQPGGGWAVEATLPIGRA